MAYSLHLVTSYEIMVSGRSGLIVKALISGLIGLGWSPGLGHCVVFSARYFALSPPRYTYGYQ